MNKLLLFLILLMMPFNVWALPDRITSKEIQGNQIVKSTSGDVFSVHVSYIGATAGDYIKLIDSTTSSGLARYTCVATASSGNCIDHFNVADYFGTAILYTEQKSSGSVFTTDIQYF